MRHKTVWVAAFVAVACVGGTLLYRSRLGVAERSLGVPLASAPPAAGPRPLAAPAEWALRHDAFRAKVKDDVLVAVGLMRDGDGDASRSAAVLDLINLPGEAVPFVEAQAARADLGDGPKAVLDRALPMLRARAARDHRRQVTREAFLQRVLAAYAKYGNHDAAWDAAARDAITLFFRCPPAETRQAEEETAVCRLFDWVVHRARCTDPLMAYACAWAEAEFELPGMQDANDDFAAAIQRVQGSRYPADWRAVIYAGARAPEVDGRYVAGINVRALSDAFDALMASDLLTPAERGLAATTLTRQGRLLRSNPLAGLDPALPDRKADFDRVQAVVSRTLAGTPEPPLLKGAFYLDWAWDARVPSQRGSTAPADMALFRERLEIARAALTDAYALDPADPRAATLMIRASRGLEDDRAAMEKWYARAMAADPDHLPACIEKLEYLRPGWYGNDRPDEMLKYARECHDSGNYRGQIPLALAEAHLMLAWGSDDPATYLGTAAAWRDVRGVYEAYLARFPADRYNRTRYAMIAAFAGQRGSAERQFAVLGDNQWPNAMFGTGLSYEGLRDNLRK